MRKTIKLMLKEDSLESPQRFRIDGETTISYKILRKFIDKDLSDDFYEELNRPGVYVLVGRRTIDNHESIYIGQSDNVAKRLYEHKGGQDGEKQKGKLFWLECLAFVTSDYQLQKGHAEFLEAEFYRIAKEANRYLLENENIPSVKTISKEDKPFCEDFINNCRLLSHLMGVPIFTPFVRQNDNIINSSEKLIISNADKRGDNEAKYVHAIGYKCQTDKFNNGFVVLENSIISNEITKKASPSLKKLRNELTKRGYIKNENGKLIFTHEYTFKSPGIAASVVLGRNASATDWKEEHNI